MDIHAAHAPPSTHFAREGCTQLDVVAHASGITGHNKRQSITLCSPFSVSCQQGTQNTHYTCKLVFKLDLSKPMVPNLMDTTSRVFWLWSRWLVEQGGGNKSNEDKSRARGVKAKRAGSTRAWV